VLLRSCSVFVFLIYRAGYLSVLRSFPTRRSSDLLCTKACPTSALRRELTPEGGKLLLDPERCLGCDACVPACPVKVVSMADEVTWGEVRAGEQVAYDSERDPGRPGAFHR